MNFVLLFELVWHFYSEREYRFTSTCYPFSLVSSH